MASRFAVRFVCKWLYQRNTMRKTKNVTLLRAFLATLRDETIDQLKKMYLRKNWVLIWVSSSSLFGKKISRGSFNSKGWMQSRPASNVSVQWSSHSRWTDKYFNKYFESITITLSSEIGCSPSKRYKRINMLSNLDSD